MYIDDTVFEMLRLWAYRYGDDVSISIFPTGQVQLFDTSNKFIAFADSFEKLMEICPPCTHPVDQVRKGILWDKPTGKKICNICGALVR